MATFHTICLVVLLLLPAGNSSAGGACPATSAHLLNFDPAPAVLETFASSDAATPDGTLEKTRLSPCLPVVGEAMRPKRRIQIDLGDGRKPWISRTGITVGGTVKCQAESGETSDGAGRASNPGCVK
jgi:hypothetical protein